MDIEISDLIFFFFFAYLHFLIFQQWSLITQVFFKYIITYVHILECLRADRETVSTQFEVVSIKMEAERLMHQNGDC